MSIGIDEWIVAWTPDDKIRVGRLGDDLYWRDDYEFVTGACWTDRHKLPLWQKIALMFIDLHSCVVRDGIDPQDAHREFLKIDEYRRRISPDIAGADDEIPHV